MKEKIFDFLEDFIIVFILCLKVVGFAALVVVPVLLGCCISPWFFLSEIIILPLVVTILIRIDC